MQLLIAKLYEYSSYTLCILRIRLLDFSDIADEILSMAAMEVLACCFVPAVVIVKRFSMLVIRLASHLLRSFRAHERVKEEGEECGVKGH